VNDAVPRYVYLHGAVPARDIRLSERVVLQPASFSASREMVDHWVDNHVDEGIVVIFLPSVTGQLRVTAADDKALAVAAWNSNWDAILLSAILGHEVSFNFESDTPADRLTASSRLRVTNHALRGLSSQPPLSIDESAAEWLETHFSKAQRLLTLEPFTNAVHSLWSYRWHTMPRARLALLWSGLEGLFSIESELSFRVSLYVSRFLEPADIDARRSLFGSTKRLYKERSAAVHGSKMKGDATKSVSDSAALLQRLVRRCIELDGIPDPDGLVP
jgi:hypothetical protein